jgi:hypothetical protein
MGRRVGAWLVDSVLVGAVTLAVFSREFEYSEEDDLQARGFADASEFCDEFMEQTDGACAVAGDRAYFAEAGDIGPAPWLVGLGLALLVYVLLQGLTGWTPGKLLFGLRTVREDGQVSGIGKALVRWLLFIVDGLCAGLVGFIVALTSKGHRRVGDMAAKTFVVGKDHAGRPIVVPGLTPSSPAGYPGTPGYPDAPGYRDEPGYSGAPGGPAGWGPPPGAPAAGAAPPTTTPGEGPSAWPPHGAEERAAGPGEPDASWGEAAPAAGAEETPWPTEAEAEASGAAEPGETGAAPSGYNPQWDPARGTYIVWSPERGQWLGWDDAAKEWRPL